jgi:hypothetical protein
MWLWWLGPGCGPGWIEDEIDGARHLAIRVSSGVEGTASVKLPVESGETAMILTAQVTDPNAVHVRTLTDPNGVVVFDAFQWNDSAYSKTNAGFVSGVVSLNWPVQIGDPGLVPGKWVADLGVVDENQKYVAAPVSVDAVLKRDVPVGSGALTVSIVYTNGLESDQDLLDAVDAAKDLWQALYAEMGVDVRFQTFAYGSGDLQPPAVGDPGYESIALDTAPRSIDLVISPEIVGYDQIFGIAGDIPGPLVPTPRSAVQVAARLAAGVDGKFSAEEIRLLAETMAHESGHYLGLFHPVESTWDAWDSLDDTPDCTSKPDCEDALGTNLMFPYPICGVATCTAQDELTHEQGGVTNRNVAVQ